MRARVAALGVATALAVATLSGCSPVPAGLIALTYTDDMTLTADVRLCAGYIQSIVVREYVEGESGPHTAWSQEPAIEERATVVLDGFGDDLETESSFTIGGWGSKTLFDNFAAYGPEFVASDLKGLTPGMYLAIDQEDPQGPPAIVDSETWDEIVADHCASLMAWYDDE